MTNPTVLLTTSPIPSHPATDLIDETLASIRHHLPEATVIILIDGLRDEQRPQMVDPYMNYIRNLASDPLCLERNVHLVPFARFTHQAGMVRQVLPMVSTPLLLFLEHDTPLVTDYEIPFVEMGEAILSGEVNLIRLLHEAHIHPEHAYLMCGEIRSHGLPLTKTLQFSARPHLALTSMYRRLLARFDKAQCFVEDFAHGICQSEPWENWKLAIYSPADNAKRSYHTNGRSGTRKYDELQVF